MIGFAAQNFAAEHLWRAFLKGVYQHCREDHLHRYLAEFDFRYNHRSALEIDDKERARITLEGIGGKRLTYKQPLSPHD